MTVPAPGESLRAAATDPPQAARTQNIVILTHGWTGSSMFSALLGQTGYWLGDQTMLKPDYDTFENAELVDFNRLLLRQLVPQMNHEHEFSPHDVDEIAARSGSFDAGPLRDFVARCNAQGRWLWKDPRLTWTVRVWAPLLDLNQTRFLVLTRDPMQAWASANLRRHVQSYRFTREYNDGITRSNLRFLAERGLPCLKLSFEDLLLAPEHTLERLNTHFGLALGRAQLDAVCRLPLHRKSRNWKDCAVAALIYLKNFGERDGRGRLPAEKLAALGSRGPG